MNEGKVEGLEPQLRRAQICVELFLHEIKWFLNVTWLCSHDRRTYQGYISQTSWAESFDICCPYNSVMVCAIILSVLFVLMAGFYCVEWLLLCLRKQTCRALGNLLVKILPRKLDRSPSKETRMFRSTMCYKSSIFHWYYILVHSEILALDEKLCGFAHRFLAACKLVGCCI